MFSKQEMEMIQESFKEITLQLQNKIPVTQVDKLSKEIIQMLNQRSQAEGLSTGLVFLAVSDALNVIVYKMIKGTEQIQRIGKSKLVQ